MTAIVIALWHGQLGDVAQTPPGVIRPTIGPDCRSEFATFSVWPSSQEDGRPEAIVAESSPGANLEECLGRRLHVAMDARMSNSDMRTSLLAIALSMLAGAFVQAQNGVDFTGHWILESPSPPSAETPRALFVRQSLVTTNVHGEPMRPSFKDITIEREVEGSIRAETYQIGVVGGVVGGTGTGGRHYSVKWDANLLVFESGSYTGQTPETGAWTECREAWSLDSDGRLHVVITTRSRSDVPRTAALVYRRR